MNLRYRFPSFKLGVLLEKAKSRRRNLLRLFIERLAATYSRRTYRTTTIGPAAFDGRVRNGNGSDRRGIATKVLAPAANCRPQESVSTDAQKLFI